MSRNYITDEVKAIIGAQTAVRLLVMDTTGWADLVARLPAYGS